MSFLSAFSQETQGKSLQQLFLKQFVATEQSVAIYLVNGIKLQGTIEAYDDYVLLLKAAAPWGTASQQLIYKQAIATIVAIESFAPKNGEVTRGAKKHSEVVA